MDLPQNHEKSQNHKKSYDFLLTDVAHLTSEVLSNSHLSVEVYIGLEGKKVENVQLKKLEVEQGGQIGRFFRSMKNPKSHKKSRIYLIFSNISHPDCATVHVGGCPPPSLDWRVVPIHQPLHRTLVWARRKVPPRGLLSESMAPPSPSSCKHPGVYTMWFGRRGG